MTRGFITVAQNSARGDYVRAAYGLALSLKRTQSNHSGLTVMVTPGTVVPDRYRAVFDQVVEIPWGDAAVNEDWKIQNKWKVYYGSPYDETILMDADMLVGMDLDKWWNILRHRPVFACTSPYTFRGDPILHSPFRTAFDVGDLPHVYTALLYFRKCDEARKYFTMVRHAYMYWNEFRNVYRLPPYVSGDLAFALGMKLTGTERAYTSTEFPGIVHMKSALQGFGNKPLDDWTQYVGVQIRPNGSLSVGGYLQRWPFHYQVKEFLTDDVLLRLERA